MTNQDLTICTLDRNDAVMKRHEYVVHYATQNPFEQCVCRVRLNSAEKRKLEREFRRGLREWRVHSYRIEEAELPVVGLLSILEELRELES